MTAADYSPQAGGLPARVIAFFDANPEEELTLDDIASKFDTVRNNIHTNLALAVSAGAVVRYRNEDGEYLYRRGGTTPPPKATKPGKPANTLTNAFNAAATSKPRGYTSTMKMLDLDALKVEENVPYMPQGTKDKSKWQPLFDKLTKPGQSIAIPGDLRGAVGAAAGKINGMKTKGTFRVAMVDSETARVWRTA